MEYLKEIIDRFFITDDRWRYFTDGLLITLQVTAGALLLGLVIGIVVSIIRSSHDQIKQEELNMPARIVFWLLNTIARLYLTVIRGTPTLVQLRISGRDLPLRNYVDRPGTDGSRTFSRS